MVVVCHESTAMPAYVSLLIIYSSLTQSALTGSQSDSNTGSGPSQVANSADTTYLRELDEPTMKISLSMLAIHLI